MNSKNSLFSGRIDAIIYNTLAVFSNEENRETHTVQRALFDFKKKETNPVPQGLYGTYTFLINHYLINEQTVSCLVMCVSRTCVQIFQFEISSMEMNISRILWASLPHYVS